MNLKQKLKGKLQANLSLSSDSVREAHARGSGEATTREKRRFSLSFFLVRRAATIRSTD